MHNSATTIRGMGEMDSKGLKMLEGTIESMNSSNDWVSVPLNADRDPSWPVYKTPKIENATKASSVASTEVAIVRAWSRRTLELLWATT